MDVIHDTCRRRQALQICAAVLTAAVVGCGAGTESENRVTAREANEVRIRKALVAMLERQADDKFVIFEVSHTRKFAQFAGSSREGLFFDLPRQALDDAEWQRATALFQELGIAEEIYDIPAGNVAHRQRSFQKDFGRDVDAATNVALQVFQRVYRVPADFDLTITTELD
jgi:hypothetical protein